MEDGQRNFKVKSAKSENKVRNNHYSNIKIGVLLFYKYKSILNQRKLYSIIGTLPLDFGKKLRKTNPYN